MACPTRFVVKVCAAGSMAQRQSRMEKALRVKAKSTSIELVRNQKDMAAWTQNTGWSTF
jgi:hypothetical protein